MKKISILFLPILVFGLVLSPQKSAHAAIQAENTTWWSVEEMVEFSHQVDKEKEDLCHDDQVCKENFYLSMYEKGGKYSALLNFLETRVWLTSINPAKETIKIFYFDEDNMMKQMGIEEKADLTHLYFGWFDDWSGQIYNYNYEQFMDGSISGLHTMYVGDEAENGAGWIPAWEEVELSVAGSDLIQNTSGKIDYAAFSGPYFNAQGYFDISNCLNAPDYREGMECKLMISGDQWASYFPPRNETEPENTITSTLDNSVQAEPVEGTSQREGLGEANIGNEQIAVSSQPEPISSVSSIQSTKENAVKTPNTGTMTQPCAQKTIEFPWWLVFLIALGDAAIIWLFWPKKSHKNPKKTLDKEK